jgi:aspartyl protease family protein
MGDEGIVRRGRDEYGTPMSGPAKTGAVFYVLASIVLIGLLTAIFSGALKKQHNPNMRVQSAQHADGTRSIELKRNRAGHYIVSGTLNGVAAEFLLDTGATDVSVYSDLARRAGLKKGNPVSAWTAAGITVAYRTRIDHIKIGALEAFDVDASIVPGFPSDQVLLGMSFLKRLDFTQRGDTLVLKTRG